jgi:DNA-binding NarL/FixJ family response regulator
MKKRVLVIDEDRNELVSFMEILKNIKDSCKCSFAHSGKQAIELLRHTTPDYIFIDYGLSQINALQVLYAIRFQSKFKETKVYLYSDHIDDDSSKMARMLGATGCIEKSCEFSNLVHKFKAIFSPELLPSYVFLKDTRPVKFFSIPDFLDLGSLSRATSDSEPLENGVMNPAYAHHQPATK